MARCLGNRYIDRGTFYKKVHKNAVHVFLEREMMGEYKGISIFSDGGRIKAKCKNSSSGDAWVGFCKFCKLSCPLAGVPKDELERAV
jgi:hypothetical protein